MNRQISLLISLFISTIAYSQNEGNIWYFGENAGLDFNSGSPIALTDGAMNTLEGCSNISDSFGNILIYTDGIAVWNSEHDTMPNGWGLMGNPTTSQSAIIIKKPSSDLIYYIFTVDFQGGFNGLRYSEVDMSLDGGLGDVNSIKNIPLVTPVCEKVTAILHENGIDFWVITHLFDSNEFNSFLVNSSGVQENPVVTNIGSTVLNISGVGLESQGYLKASQNGNRIAIANNNVSIEVFDFNTTTGIISNPLTFTQLFDGANQMLAYGIEFSPNNNLLYVNTYNDMNSENYLIQFNLLGGSYEEIYESRVIIESSIMAAALQIGPDQKIYALSGLNTHLSVISDPNQNGIECNYLIDAVYLGGKVFKQGLPNFLNSIFKIVEIEYENTCFEDLTEFGLNNVSSDSVFWNFGDSESELENVSDLAFPLHQFTDTGSYEVSCTYFSGGISNSLQRTIYISSFPIIDLGFDSNICEGQIVMLDASYENATYLWQDQSSNPTFLVLEDGEYWVNVNVNNCISSDSISFESCSSRIVMPTIFSPNNDNKNDFFVPVELSDVININLRVFDRWGSLIFESHKITSAWDGTFNGKDCTEGCYFWTAKFYDNNGIEYENSGSITIVR